MQELRASVDLKVMEAVEMGISSSDEDEDRESEFDRNLYMDQVCKPSVCHDKLMRNNGFYDQLAPVHHGA